MSADNGIYIAKFPDGYRVAYAMGIDNIDYYCPGTKARKKELRRYFGESPLFVNQEDAEKYAFEIYHRMEKDEEENGLFGVFILEYGVCHMENMRRLNDRPVRPYAGGNSGRDNRVYPLLGGVR